MPIHKNGILPIGMCVDIYKGTNTNFRYTNNLPPIGVPMSIHQYTDLQTDVPPSKEREIEEPDPDQRYAVKSLSWMGGIM